MKLSMKYRILRACMKAAGVKKRLSGSKEELLKMAEEDAAKKKIPQLKSPDLDITVCKFEGEDVVCMNHKQKTDRVCIFLIGGGMIKYPRPDALKKAMKICVETGRDFIVPYYPLCINQSVKVAYDFMYRLYKETLQRYKAENILFCGSSSGAYLALGLVSHINAMGEGLPIPSKIYASSPGTCFDKQEEWDAACKPILSGLERDGVKVILEVGEGLFHCYPFFSALQRGENWLGQDDCILKSVMHFGQEMDLQKHDRHALFFKLAVRLN